MADLDALLAARAQQAQPDPLDAMLSARAGGAPVASPAAPLPPAGFTGSSASGGIQGLRDLENGGAQWLYNNLPAPVQKAGDAVDHWLFDKTGGAVGTNPSLNFNQAVADQNTSYEQGRQANGRTGLDLARAGGNAGGQAMLMATGMPALPGVAGGVMSGALAPVTNADSSGDFWSQKGKDIGYGGALGGVVSAVGNGIASVVKPKVSAMADALMKNGVSLTPGEILGGFAKRTEDKLASVPVLGDLIKGAQGRSVESLNTATYGRVLQPLKDAGFPIQVPKTAGREAVDAVTQQVKDAYNEIVPKLVFKADQQFASELGSLQNMAKTGLGPQQAEAFDRIVQNNVQRNMIGGTSAGKTLQGMLSDVQSAAQGYLHDPSFENRQLGAALQTLSDSLQGGLKRSNPAQAATLDKIDAAFANLARVQTAAGAQGSANGVFTPAQLAAAVKGGDNTVRDNAYARGKALLQDLSDPAKSVLSATVPNSGTTDRALAAGATGAILSKPSNLLNPVVLAGAVPSLAYTKLGQQAATFALTKRPAGAQALADQLRNGADKASTPISAALLRLLVAPK